MYARIQNGVAVDVRSESPVGCFTDNFVAQFVTVPDDVRNGWLFDGTDFAAPPEPPAPTQEELDAIAAAEAARVLTVARAALIQQIDADTDAIYRAVQGDRAMEYLQAEADAKSYKAAGYNGTVPDSVASWSGAKKQNDKWAADDILATATGWRQAQSSIRATRLACKEQARTATDLAPIVATWSGFLVTVKSALGL